MQFMQFRGIRMIELVGQRGRIYLLKTCVRHIQIKLQIKSVILGFTCLYGNKTVHILQVILWFIYVPSKLRQVSHELLLTFPGNNTKL